MESDSPRDDKPTSEKTENDAPREKKPNDETNPVGKAHPSVTQVEIDFSEPELFRTLSESTFEPLPDDAGDKRPIEGVIVGDTAESLGASGSLDDNPAHEHKTLVFSPEVDNTLSAVPTLPPEEYSDQQRAKMGTFGEYELLDILGRGGMGLVYKAKQPRLNRIVALKMVIQGQLDSEAEIQRFKSEAEAVAKLDHPGIVPVYDVGEIDGRQYFSMAYVEGKSLSNIIVHEPMSPRHAAKTLAKIADAIGHAHERGILHRDLKPSNVLIDTAGQPRVIDFGLAKRFEEDANLTATGMVVGTPSYMAPERIDERLGDVGPASDVYSLGAMLYEMLSGKPPFNAPSPVETMEQVLRGNPTSLTRLNARIPAELDAICLHCLQKDPKKRYASAEELAQDLRRWLDYEPVVAPQATPPRPARPVLAAMLAVLAVAAIASSGYLALRLKQTTEQATELNNQVAREAQLREEQEVAALQLRNQLDSLQASVTNAEARVAEADAATAEAKKQLQDQVRQASRLDEELKSLRTTRNNLTAEIHRLESRQEPLTKSLHALMDERGPRDFERQVDYWSRVPGGVEADLRTTQGLAAFKDGDARRALQLFNQAVEACPQYFSAFYYRALVRLNQNPGNAGDVENAIKDLGHVVDALPDSVAARTLRAKAFLELDQVDKARVDISHARSIAPQDPHLLVLQAICLWKSDKVNEAGKDFEQALTLDPDYAKSHFEYARFQLIQQQSGRADFGTAVEHAAKACELTKRSNPDYVLLLAVAQSNAGQFQDAIQNVNEAERLYADDVKKNYCKRCLEQLGNEMKLLCPPWMSPRPSNAGGRKS